MRLLFTVLLLVPVSLFSQEKGRGKGPGPFDTPAKNLKILTQENLRPAMVAFRVGLGVQCTFCHVEGDFASDENPKKEIARKMMGMAQEINSKFPDGKQHVSCYTCHRGETEPKMTPPPAAPPPAAPPQ
jgi:hypothetical protein